MRATGSARAFVSKVVFAGSPTAATAAPGLPVPGLERIGNR